MWKRIVLCLAILSLLLTACGRKVDSDPDAVNIMCLEYQARVIRRVYGSFSDTASPKLHFITDSGYESVLKWQEDLHKNLLAHSPGIDIYCLDSLDEYAYRIIREHYYVDLSRDDVLAQNFDAMYPEVKQWCSCEDEIFGFPYGIDWRMVFLIDETQTGSAGFDREDFGTVEELLAFYDAWKEQSAVPPAEGYTYIYLYCAGYIMEHYDRSTGELELDNPQFRELLAQCRELSRPGAIFELPDEADSPHVSFTSPIRWFVYDQMRQRPEAIPVPYPLLPGEDADAKRMAQVSWMILNPYGKRIDESLYGMRSLTGLAANLDTHSPPVYRYAGSYPDDWYTQDQLDHVGSMLKKMDVGFRFPGFDQVLSACIEYIEGDATLDKAVAESQHIIDMARKEQYIGEE